MIRAIEEKTLQQRGIPSNGARPQSRCIRALGQADEDDQIAKAVASEATRCIERAERRVVVVAVNLRIAFVGRDDKAIIVRPAEQRAPLVEAEDAPCRVSWGA